jgi:outer membrane protein TolC
VLGEALQIDRWKVELARSDYWPQIGLKIGWKRIADNFTLTRNNYRNLNNSYISVGVKWKVWDGGVTTLKVEEAKAERLEALLYYRNYLNRVKGEYRQELNTIEALRQRLKGAEEELKAKRAYYLDIKSRFENRLVDSTYLTRALSQLQQSRAKVETLKSLLFLHRLKAYLSAYSHLPSPPVGGLKVEKGRKNSGGH